MILTDSDNQGYKLKVVLFAEWPCQRSNDNGLADLAPHCCSVFRHDVLDVTSRRISRRIKEAELPGLKRPLEVFNDHMGVHKRRPLRLQSCGLLAIDLVESSHGITRQPGNPVFTKNAECMFEPRG